jgi:hypothetical protein
MQSFFHTREIKNPKGSLWAELQRWPAEAENRSRPPGKKPPATQESGR